MAKHRRHHRRTRRHNPFGISGGVVKDAAYNTGGALGSMWLSSLVGQSGWMDVAANGGAAVALSFAGKYVGGASASEELLKGGLTATIIKALHQLGITKSLGLGSYVPSYFALPTSSDAFGRTTSPFAALPAPSPKLSGYQRYRSRYHTRF